MRAEPETSEHGGEDGREHDFEHGEIGQVELAHQLARAAEACALQRPAESKADQEGGRERSAVADQAVACERRDQRQLRLRSGAAR